MMNTSSRTTVVGVFHDRQHAQQAVAELKRAGFSEADIGVIARDDDKTATGTTGTSTTGTSTTGTGEKGSHVAAGAATGVAAGAGVGALWALGIAAGMLPAIGPVIAGGLLASVLASAAGGATLAGIVGALIGLGIPEDEAQYYESEVKGGRTLVTVKASGQYNQALAIIKRFGGYDRSSQPASTSTTQSRASMPSTAARTTSTAPTVPAQTAGTMHTQTATSATGAHAHGSNADKLELREEQVEVHKQPVQTGEVKVRKEVVTEHKTIDVPVQREEVVIERHPVSGQASSADIGRGEEIRVPVSKEQVELEKKTVVREEVSVGKRQVQDTEHASATVRKEEAHVEREGDVNVQGENVDVNDQTGKEQKGTGKRRDKR